MFFFPLLLSSLVQIASCMELPRVVLNGTVLYERSINFQGSSQQFFGGIPYGKSPVGQLRFAQPDPFYLQGSSLTATEYGPPCPQFGSPPDATEDCLTINVLRPAGLTPQSTVPVMAWIFGGGFNLGNTSVYNASNIVQKSVDRGTPIIYVNFNYRLGPFGFPQGTEAASNDALNLGLKDQLLALQWIQSNIHAFGGDPKKVTLFGESAGAISISLLYLNSHLERFARAAILESGSPMSWSIGDSSLREFEWQHFIEATPECVGVDPNDALACLRSANTSTLIQSYNAVEGTSPESPYAFGPCIDGPDGVVPDHPYKLLAEGSFSRIPFIAGTNKDEGTLFVPSSISGEEEVLFTVLTQANPTKDGDFPPNVEAAVQSLLTLYPDSPALGSPFGTGNETFGLSPEFKQASAIMGDIMFQAPRRAWSQSATQYGVRNYGYIFTDPQAVPVDLPMLGDSHASELYNLYGFSIFVPHVDTDFSTIPIIDYWISFATSLDPNDGKGVSRPYWPPYDPTNMPIMELTTPNGTVVPDTYRASQIAAINAVAKDINH